MKLKILFFARAREIVGQPEIELTLADGADTEAMIAEVVKLYPPLGDVISNIVIAVNQEYLEGKMSLKDRDEIAFIPPISGG
mmetsp:Transcript_10299/g.21492  ORF Transcript_10299/g.21492 Transcript_10299/m.21492 type:complete len:82 (+) Transcript_10299:388-633(+)|eukprot:CAMPEP_0118924964 /NCGR_PEP_ID=MMETSP1169-20130426/2898_1 /TAXON_ID=36882 /ORGANISM="Pyramimonas obovata, Strain CCMP722" /LENGTH=81 /DNA_ID=CAMNT_0006866129 /DNA_START=344 /DNA_END=589 /DNA_ORIENTATION=-